MNEHGGPAAQKASLSVALGQWFGSHAARNERQSATEALPVSPMLGFAISIVAFMAGVAAGFADRNGLPVYTANFTVLTALMILGTISVRGGAWAFCGFVVADGIRQFSGDFGELSFGYVVAVVASWIFLHLLLVSLPQSARALTSFKGRFSVFSGLLCAICVGAFAELWTRLSMIALRPLFIWRGQEMDLQLVEFIEYEWTFEGFTFHQLAWLALAAGLVHWVMSSITLALNLPIPSKAIDDSSKLAAKLPWYVGAFGKSVSFTAIIAGIFTTVIGAVLFGLSIFGAIAIRAIASSHSLVGRWDGWMLRIPAPIRLIASYALSFYLAVFLVEILRDSFGWRTMTTAAVGTFVVFAASLPFWPQIAPDEKAPEAPKALQRIVRSATHAAPSVMVLLLCFSATAAYAHHCSFGPGCECLTDERALAALIAAGAAVGLFLLDQTWVGVARGLHDAIRGIDLLTGQRLSLLDRVLAGVGSVPVLGAPADALRAARMAERVPTGFTRAYRAVSQAEYDEIIKSGRFSLSPNSVEGKYFSDTIEGVVRHGDGLEGAGKYRIIEADIPNNAPSLYTWENLDGHGPARFIHIDDLKDVRPRIYK